jgi:predicted permease
VVEALLLSLAAGVVATLVAGACVEAIRWIAPTEVTFGMVHEFGLEGRALALVFAVASGVGLLVGVLPGLRLSTVRVAGSGPPGARGRDRAAGRLRTVLVSGEIAISVVLLVGAGLFLRSFGNMLVVDMGMETGEVAFATVDLPERAYGTEAERADFMRNALERLAEIPGVISVSVSSGTPPQGGGLAFSNGMRGEDGAGPLGEIVLPTVDASPGFLATLGTEFVAGRDLTEGDLESGGVIVDRDLAELLFEGGGAVGRRFTLDAGAEDVRWLTVVGVVEELALGGPDDRNGGGALITPLDPEAPSSWQVYTVRTAGDPDDLITPMRAAFRSLDDRLPLSALQTGEQAFGESLSRPRFIVLLFSVLAWLALILSAIGIYGVVSYAVRQRRRELGIRIALGAPASTVRAGILRWGLTMASVGTLIGVTVALQLDDAAEALLFGVAPRDLATLAGVAVVMLAVATVACLLPAVRATRVDPVEALRSD